MPGSALGWAAKHRLALATVIVVGMLSSGCGPNQSAAPPGAALMRVTERDFHISAPKHVSTGNLLLQVKNDGPDSHELIIVRNNDQLPLRDDGITVDEEALQQAEVGVLEPGEVGTLRQLRLHLSAGRYQYFCNMAGHYMAGMHGELVVR